MGKITLILVICGHVRISLYKTVAEATEAIKTCPFDVDDWTILDAKGNEVKVEFPECLPKT